MPSVCAHLPPLPLAATRDWDFTSCPIRRGTWGWLKCGPSGGVKAEGGPAAAGGWAALSGRSRRRDAHGPLAGDAGDAPPTFLRPGKRVRLAAQAPCPFTASRVFWCERPGEERLRHFGMSRTLSATQ